MELHTDDVTLHYEDDGDPDAPPVLCLHGITQSGATWRWLVPHLTGRHQVGHSLGGGTGAALAQTRPELVRGVVLEDPAIMAAPTAEAPVALEGNSLLDGFQLMRESVPHLQAAGTSHADLVAILRGAPSPSGPPFGELVHDDALDAMAEGLLQLDASVLDPIFSGSHDPVFDPEGELPVPGIVLAGDPALPDTLVRESDLERLAKHSPQVECRVVAGAGHLIHDSEEHRHAVLDAIEDVLARL